MPEQTPNDATNHNHLHNALNYHTKANGVMFEFEAPHAPPFIPTRSSSDLGILGEANTTLTRLTPGCQECGPKWPPLFQAIISQAHLTRSLAAALRPEGPPM